MRRPARMIGGGGGASALLSRIQDTLGRRLSAPPSRTLPPSTSDHDEQRRSADPLQVLKTRVGRGQFLEGSRGAVPHAVVVPDDHGRAVPELLVSNYPLRWTIMRAFPGIAAARAGSFAEERVLRAAAEVERALSWADNSPSILAKVG